MIDYIEWEGACLFRYNLETREVDLLRKMVRSFKLVRNSTSPTGMEIAGMNKVKCIDWLLQVEPVLVTAEEQKAVSEFIDQQPSGRFIPEGEQAITEGKAFDQAGERNGQNGHSPASSADALVKAMAEALAGQIKAGSIDREEIAAWVEAEVAAKVAGLDEKYRELIDGKVTRIEVWDKTEGQRELDDQQHFMFEHIFKMAQLRLNIALVGPAGSGKTHLAEQVAKALKLPFEPISVGPQTSQSQIMGYMDGHGHYVETAFYRKFKDGGVVLLDEFDAAHPGVATCINGATANSGAGFPCGYIPRHPDFICIIAMNTWGSGASTAYVGRQAQDKATMNRFSFVEFNYDEKLERELCEHKEWCLWVQRARKSLFALGSEGKDGVRHIISPRASYAGAKMLNAGMDRKFVEDCVVWQGLAKTEIAKILGGMA